MPGDEEAGAELCGLLDADLPAGDPFGQVRHRVLGRVPIFCTRSIRYLCRLIAPLAWSLGRGIAGQAHVGGCWKNPWSSYGTPSIR